MDLRGLFNYALVYCYENGSKREMSWIKSLPLNKEKMNNAYFLSELAWCVYNAGMKEKVLRDKWAALSNAFCDFQPEVIVHYEPRVLVSVLRKFNHKGKVMAVIEAAKRILTENPIEKMQEMTEAEVLDYLQTFTFIGSVTKYHLARNLGFDVVKPDRHLVRLTEFCRYESPDLLVSHVVELTGERKGFIDFIFWRWLSLAGPAAYNEPAVLAFLN